MTKEALLILDNNLKKIGYSVKEPTNAEHQEMMEVLIKAMMEFAAHACELQKIQCFETAEVEVITSDTLTEYRIINDSILKTKNIINAHEN